MSRERIGVYVAEVSGAWTDSTIRVMWNAYPSDQGLSDMNQNTGPASSFLPIWVWLIVVAQILLVSFFSVGTAMNPAAFIPEVSELNYVTQLYVTRNVTVVLGMVGALLLRSHKGLLVILVVRLLTDVADVITVYALHVEVIKSSVPMVVVLLIVPALLASGYLWKRVGRKP